MHTSTVIVAAFAAAASVVSAAEGQARPKIYFPRNLKRQYSNMTITTQSPASQSTPFDTAPETTKRDPSSLTDLLESFKDIFTDKPTFTDKPASITLTSDTPSSADSTDAIGSSSSAGSVGSAADVTTVIVQSTIVVSPSSEATPTSAVADPITAAAPSTDSVTDSPNGSAAATPSDSSVDVASGVGSTGGIPATIVTPTTPVASTPESASPTDPAAPTTVSEAKSDTASPSVDPTSSALFSSGEPTSEATSTTGILLAPTGIVTSATEEASPTLSPTLSDPLAPINSILSSVVSEVTSAILPSVNVTDIAPTAPVTSTPVSEVSTSVSAEPTDLPSPSADPSVEPSASASPTTPETEQPSATLDPTLALTTALPDPTSTPDGISLSLTLFPGTGSSTIVDTTPPVTNEPTAEPTTVIPLPVTNGTDSSLTTPTLEPTGVTVEPTSIAVGPTTTPEPTNTALEPTGPPITANSTITDLPPNSSPTADTTLPSSTAADVTQPPVSDPTLLPTVGTIAPNGTAGVNTTIPEDTATDSPAASTVLPSPTTIASITSIDSAPGVTSIAATATLSGTETTNWLPTTMVVDQPATGTTTQRLAPTATASTLPSSLPQAITPNSDNTTIPVDTTVIGVTFRQGLNYEFVVNNGAASAQIFQFLPDALKAIGNFPGDKIQMVNLGPNVGTQATLGYIATIAKVTFPSNAIDTLKLQLITPNSRLYNQGEEIVKNLTRQINPAIDIITFNVDGAGVGGSGGSAPGSSSGGGSASDPLGGNASGQTASKPGQQGTTAGIALGVIGVAGAYGAAMFIVARRYKRKKQAHRRASSITNTSEMRSAAGSPHLMGGALLSRDFSSYGGVAGGRNSHGTQGSGRSGANNSARTAYISGPMSAENSLGWN